jgi:hypothetical protein
MKNHLTKFLLVAIATIFQFVSNAQTVDEVIASHVTATGGAENWKKVQSMKITGHVEVQGIEISFSQQAVHGKGFRVDAEFQGMQIIEICTPTKSWSQNPFGGKTSLEPNSEEEHKQRVDQLDIQNEFVDWKEKGSSVELLGKDEEDGNEYFKVRLTTKTGNTTVYFIDIKTYLVYKTKRTSKMQGQEMEMETKMYDYKPLPIGIKVPHKTDQMGQVLVFEKVEVNTAIADSLFEVK